MNKTSTAVILAATVVMLGMKTNGASSPPVVVDTSPSLNRHWSTVFTNEIPLRWEWNTEATHAELEITGMNGSFVTNFLTVTSNYVWRIFTGNTPPNEDVHNLTLTFYNGTGILEGALNAHLTVINGAFGQTVVDPGPSDWQWTTVKKNAVIPYDATWSNSTVNAMSSQLVIAETGVATQTNTLMDAAGYFGWKLNNSIWEYGTIDLSLTFPEAEGEWNATLTYVMGGTVILVL